MADLKSKHRLIETTVITGLMLLLTLLLEHFPLNIEVIQPINQESSDFSLYDIIYSGESTENHTRDTTIVLMQAADSRREIAAQLQLLQKYSPAVIGIDLTFVGHSDDPAADDLLAKQLSRENIITGNRIGHDPNGDDIIVRNFFDSSSSHLNYFNFWGDSISVVRSYPPFLSINDTEYFSFSSRIAEKFNPEAFATLQKKWQKHQVINYNSNVTNYTSFIKGEYDTAQLAEKVRGKIVLLGVLHKRNPLLLEDLHFTPMNEKVNGKSFPDMYGVVIHANILSMIFSGKYIHSLSRIWSYLITATLLFFIIFIQMGFYYRKKHPNELLFLGLQFLLVFLLSLLFLGIYKWFHCKVSLFPILIPVVLCIEVIGVYRFFIKKLFKNSRYQSIFKKV